MKLLLDIGNSRIKLGVSDNSSLLHSSAQTHNLNDLRKTLNDLNKRFELKTAVIVCVAKETLYQDVQGVLNKICRLQATRFLSESQSLGVANAYKNPQQLGADRWAAVIAAHKLYKGDVLVCDLGTAATLDFVDSNGQHQGGYILPGLEISRRALQTDTAALPKVDGGELDPADQTNAAIANGTVLQLVAAIEKAMNRKDTRECVLTGGDAQQIGNYLSHSFHYEPDLVLKGLAMAEFEEMRTGADKK